MKTKEAKENAVCVLVRLSQNKEEEEAMIGRAVAILHLVKLLEGGGLRGKKNVATMWYTLCLVAKENKVKAVSAGVMRALVELMVGLGSSMEDLGLSLVYLVGMVVAVAEGIYDFRVVQGKVEGKNHGVGGGKVPWKFLDIGPSGTTKVDDQVSNSSSDEITRSSRPQNNNIEAGTRDEARNNNGNKSEFGREEIPYSKSHGWGPNKLQKVNPSNPMDQSTT
ncbi:hypothetical protein GYH30_043079 [Glycine max]|nr:hypothetical protein GYH30_043079 [Glycine max]